MRLSMIALPLVIGAIMCSPSIAYSQKIVGHRGASQDAPENTLASFRLAWEQGADAIEGDFYLAKDQQIVCIHDANTKRTAAVERVVSTSTLKELRQLDVGSWKNASFQGEKIPTLAEVLQTVPADKQIFIEIKCGPEIVPHLVPALRESRLRPEQTVVISFNDQVIAATRKQIPDIKAYWLVGLRQNKETNAFEPTIETILTKARELQASGVDVQANRDVVNADFIKRLRDEKLEVHTWTVNDAAIARHFQSLGIDSITTDRPAGLRAELNAP